jgi:hypothetical protein
MICPLQSFKNCNETYKVPYSFVLINKNEHPNSGKYFRNKNQLYIPLWYFSNNRSKLSPEFSVLVASAVNKKKVDDNQ